MTNKPICPRCGNTALNYDSFEDMYMCGPCYMFYYPDEVGVEENPEAGVRKL